VEECKDGGVRIKRVIVDLWLVKERKIPKIANGRMQNVNARNPMIGVIMKALKHRTRPAEEQKDGGVRINRVAVDSRLAREKHMSRDGGAVLMGLVGAPLLTGT